MHTPKTRKTVGHDGVHPEDRLGVRPDLAVRPGCPGLPVRGVAHGRGIVREVPRPRQRHD